MRGLCSAEAKAACPLTKCVGSDTHHTYYPRRDYSTKIEKNFRELPFNKQQLPRCVHSAIHASGYIPAKPSRDEMLAGIWHDGSVPQASIEEHDKQLYISQELESGEL